MIAEAVTIVWLAFSCPHVAEQQSASAVVTGSVDDAFARHVGSAGPGPDRRAMPEPDPSPGTETPTAPADTRPSQSVPASPSPSTTIPVAPAEPDQGPGWLTVGLGVLAGAGAGIAGALFVRGRRSPAVIRTAPSGMPPPWAAPVTVRTSDQQAVGQQRAILLAAAMDTRDVVPSDVLRNRLDKAIGEAGVTVIHPQPGDRFDPRHHRALIAVATSTQAHHDTVAQLVKPGFVDGGRLLRPAEVEVFQWTLR